MFTPWGSSDSQERLAPGITRVHTPSHGGIHLSDGRLDEMPAALREVGEGAWFEEDCDWSAVAVAFPDVFDTDTREFADRSLRDWYPDVYERHYGVVLGPGESHTKDEQAFYAEHADDLIVVSAVVVQPPSDGQVLCHARVGGVHDPNVEARRFLVPADEYRQRQRAFVIDPDRHDEVLPELETGPDL